MRVYVSIDMEGVCGVADPRDCQPGHPEWERSRRLMTGEASAAVAGAFDAGATEVVVNDSHDGMFNLLPEELDERARLLRGGSKPQMMVEGLEPGFGVALFVGYHAMAGTRDAVLAHTMTGPRIQGFWLDGEPAGELLLNAAVAAHHGVPVGLVSGDRAACAEARAVLPGVRTAEVKEARGSFAAIHLAPAAARASIRREAQAAVADAAAGGLRPLPRPERRRLEVRFASPAVAQAALCIPGLLDVDSRTVAAESASMPELMGLIGVLCDLVERVGDQLGYA